MTTDHHTPVSYKALVNSATVNNPLAQLDEAISEKTDLVNPSAEGITVSADGDVTIKLGDSSGARKVIITDQSDAVVATIDSDGHIDAVALYRPPNFETCVLVSDVATITDKYATMIKIDTEGEAAADNCQQIEPHADWKDGHIIYVTSLTTARDVTLKHNTGGAVANKIYITSDFILDNPRDVVMLMLKGVSGTPYWVTVSKMDNAT